MDKVLPLFHSDVFIKDNVGTDEQREDLKKQILHAKENDLGTQSGGNDGCWRSNAKYEMDWLYDEMRSLSNEVNNIYFESDPTYKMLLKKCDNREFGVWTNVNEVGSKNVLHTHTEDAWAGIYYVQSEGTGNLMFHNPANTLQQCNKFSPFIRKSGIIPKDGMLILWPGWVPHEVEENKSNQQRINLAWGINFK